MAPKQDPTTLAVTTIGTQMEDVEQRFRECLCATAENEQQISKPQGEVQSGRHDMKMMKGNILSEVRMRFQEFSKPIPQIYSSGGKGEASGG